MEPVYREIGYCSDVGTLWRKLKSRQCDWLGIDENGNYRLGYPKRQGGVTESLLIQASREGAVVGAHTVRIYDDPAESTPAFNDVLLDEESAKAEFDRIVQERRTSPNHRLSRVQRIEEGVIVQEWLGVAGHHEKLYPEGS